MKATRNILFALQAARLLIDAWCQHARHLLFTTSGGEAWCIMGSVGAVDQSNDDPETYLDFYAASQGYRRPEYFNDLPGTNHKDVLRMLDGAIARAAAEVFG